MAKRRINLAWAHVALGSAGVVAVCVFYVLSPPLAISANLNVDLESARAAAIADTGFLRLAGIFGALVDPFITVGAIALAVSLQKRDAERQAVGLYWLGAVALLYTVYDTTAGFALRAAALGGPATFSVVKVLIDALLCSASLGYGISGVLVGWPDSKHPPIGPRFLRLGLIVVGLVLIASSLATIIGLNGGLAIGLALGVSILLMTSLYTWLGLLNLRAPV